jgi:cytochrome P450
MTGFKEVLATAKGSPGLVTNDVIGGSALIYLTDLELIKEFFVKEVSVARRGDVGDLKVNFSFFFDNSEHGLTHRGVFAELFKLENIVHSIPIIHAVAKSQLADLVGSEAITFDFRQKHEELVKEVARKVLFGDKTEVPRCPDKENTMVTEMVFRILHEVGSNKGLTHPLNVLFFGLPNKLNLLEASKLGAKRAKMVFDVIIEAFNERMNDPNYQLGVNVLDLMIKNNKTNPGHQFSPADIVGDTALFLFAGSDTTSKTIIGCTYYLGKYPEYITKIREEIERFDLNRPDVTFDDLDKSATLDAFIKEVLRLRSPAPSSFERIITKDFKLGSYDIKAGDKVVYPICFLSSEKGFFPASDQFNPENFMGDSMKRVSQVVNIPFGAGRRSCLGKLLAEAIVKVTLIELVSNYDIFVPKDDKNAWKIGFGVEIKHCTVRLSRHTKN